MANLQPPPDDGREITEAVIYGAKSTQDRRRSIDTQHDDARAKCAEEGWTVIGRPFADDGFSAYSGDRGPDLAEAIALAAERAAELGRPVALVTQALDRFARGAGDAPGAARHLSELWHDLRRRRVHLRTAEDDEDTRDPGTIADAGQHAMRESRRKSMACGKGIGRVAARGDWTGGRVPDGYVMLSRPNPDVEARKLGLDPERAAIIRQCLNLGLRGFTSGETARQLNGDGLQSGFRRRSGDVEMRPWTRRRVREVWQATHYAGLVRHRGELLEGVEGKWPKIIKPDEWRRLQDVTASRAKGTTGKQRRTNHHLLAGLCICGHCGGAIHALGNGRPKKDGTLTRRYVCANARDVNDACHAPRVDAAAIEAPFVANLEALSIDVGEWIERRAADLGATRAAWEARAEHERAETCRLDGLLVKARAEHMRHVENERDDRADVAADAVAALKRRREQTATRLAECEAAAEATPTTPDADAVLDFYAALREALAGHLRADAVGDANARLREALSCVVVTPEPDGSVRLRAHLSATFLAALGDPGGFAAVSEVNGGPPIERLPGGLAAVLDSRGEVGSPSHSCTTSR